MSSHVKDVGMKLNPPHGQLCFFSVFNALLMPLPRRQRARSKGSLVNHRHGNKATNKSQLRIMKLVFLILVFLKLSSAAIECHYCGLRYLCPLPYDEDITERVTCEKSCMKFDGNSLIDNKRVIVRGCGEIDINKCSKNVTMTGAIGTQCLCNGVNCNSAPEISLNYMFMLGQAVIMIFMIFLI